MRSAFHNWFLRCAALLIFISGGALARAVAQDFETYLAPFESPIREKQIKASVFEVRQPTLVQLEGATLTAEPVFLEVRATKPCAFWLEFAPVVFAWRPFDALAPPRV